MAGTREYGLAPAPEPEQVLELTRVVLVATRWHSAIVERMVEGATRALQAQGVAADYIEVVRVPGAWELPLAASWYALAGGYDAVIALGCVIRGDTPHFDFIAGECARGLMQVQMESGLPVAFGVLTCETLAQAEERADPARMDKGGEAARAVTEMLLLKSKVDD